MKYLASNQPRDTAEVRDRCEVGTTASLSTALGRLPHGNGDIRLIGTAHWHTACACRTLRELFELRENSAETLIAVELPEGIEGVVAEALEKIYATRHVCALILPYERNDDREKNEAIVLSAADAITHAILFAQRNRMPWVCIDLPTSSACDKERLGCDWPDPWAGLELVNDYTHLLHQRSASLQSCARDRQREEHMAAVLLDNSRRYRRIVAVVGAAHLHGIATWLSGQRLPQRQQALAPTAPPSLACVDGLTAVSRHLGPLPFLAVRLAESASSAQAIRDFDPRSEIDAAIRGAIHDYQYLDDRSPNAGQLARFQRAAWKKVCAKRDVLPSAAALCRAASAAVDEDFALLLSRRLFGDLVTNTTASEYPILHRDASEDQDYLKDIDGWHVPVSVHGSPSGGVGEDDLSGMLNKLTFHWKEWMRRFFDERERQRDDVLAGRTSDTTWRSWRRATVLARGLAQVSKDKSTRKWQGGIIRRLDVPGTIRARVHGRPQDIWCETIRLTTVPPQNELDEFEPVCWIFSPATYGSFPSAFTTGTSSGTYVTSHVYATWPSRIHGPEGGWVEYLGGRLVLAPTDTLRHSASSKALFQKWRLEAGRRIPNISLWESDSVIRERLSVSELSWYERCSPHERLLAGAICHARRYAIYVRPAALPASRVLSGIGRRLGIQILEVDLAQLGWPLVEQIRRFEFK